MSARDTSGSVPQHSHPHNNTMSRNEKSWVDQVTPPPPPPENDKGRGTTKGGGVAPVVCQLVMTSLPTWDVRKSIQEMPPAQGIEGGNAGSIELEQAKTPTVVDKLPNWRSIRSVVPQNDK